MTASMNEYSVESLDGFLGYLGDKGYMPKASVVSRKAACNKMFGILHDDERGDVRALDLEEVASRFQNLEGQKYTSDSLRTYKSRVTKSVEDFLRYKQDPANFKVKKTTSSAKKVSETKAVGVSGGQESSGSAQAERPSTKVGHTSSGLSIPIPVREHLVVQIINVPFDLTKTEARKIANVVLALAGGEDG